MGKNVYNILNLFMVKYREDVATEIIVTTTVVLL